MSTSFFSYEDVQPLVDAFCDEIPKLLGEHVVTADLVPRVLGLSEVAETPFTVAIVGQMRVGKSSLINAILKKNLAVTGVTETTAAINWIHYGDDSDTFRVHWKDRSAESFPRAELGRWVGDSELAAQTRYIEFFDDAQFLKVASLVDTPGLRSVIQSHEDATTSFLGTQHDTESRHLGSQADAVVYVLMPVARETDDAFLTAFQQNTRLPGASSYNSLAVLHKWETLESDDLVAESRKKAARVGESLAGSVSEVFPVSAPLALAAYHQPDWFWEGVLKLATESSPAALRRCLVSERKFRRDIAECGLAAPERERLLEAGVPWPCLKVIVGLAADEAVTDIAQLREVCLRTSQVDYLRAELDRRFFSRSRSLKILSVVSKAWEPCQLAQVRLRAQRAQVSEMLARADSLLEMLNDRVAHGDADLLSVADYIRVSREALRRESHTIDGVLQRISELAVQLRAVYDDFSRDMRCLEVLDGVDGANLEPETRRMLESLFGARGPAHTDRLKWAQQQDHDVQDGIDRAIGVVRMLEVRSREPLRSMFGHAGHRLEQLGEHYELAETVG